MEKCTLCLSIYYSINENKKPIVLTNCGHTLHNKCFKELKENDADAKCPKCRAEISSTNAINYAILPFFENFCSQCEKEKEFKKMVVCGDCDDKVCKDCEPMHFDLYLKKISSSTSKAVEDINSWIENGKQIKNSSFADLEYANNYYSKRIPQIKDPVKSKEIENEVLKFKSKHSELDKEISEQVKILENYEKDALKIKKKLENVIDSNRNLKYLSDIEAELRNIMSNCKPFKKDDIIDFNSGLYNVDNPTINKFNKWIQYELASSKFDAKFDATKLFTALKSDLDGENTRLQVSIAIMGRSGVGKSTFINTLRGLAPTSRGAIKAGIVESTIDVTPYFIENFGNNYLNKSELNNNSGALINNAEAIGDVKELVYCDEFIVWDTPGVSTPRFRLEAFEKTIDQAKCDAFVYLYETQFTEDDLKAVKMLKRKEKPVLICRTKVDYDFLNLLEKHWKKAFKNITKEEREESYKVLKLFDSLKKKYEEDKNQNQFLVNERVFFISTKIIDCNKFDYNEFVECVYRSLPDIKSNMLLKMVKATSFNLLSEKKKILESEIDSVVIEWVTMQPSWGDLKKYIHGKIQDYTHSFGILEMIEALGSNFGKTDDLLEELNSRLPCEVISKEDLAKIRSNHGEIDDHVNLDFSIRFQFYFKNLGLRDKLEKAVKIFMQRQLNVLYQEATKIFKSYYLNEYETKIKKKFQK